MKSMLKIEFSKKELTLIKKAREDVFGALTKIQELDFSREGGVASIQAILLLGVTDDLLILRQD
jgi:hypothetical protein